MKFNSQYFTFGVMGLLAGALWFYYGEYQDKAKEYVKLKLQYDGQIIAINQQQTQIQHLAELDKIHTEKLANDKIEIDALRADVAAGRRKLQLNATCRPMSEAPSSGSMGDAATPQLTEPAKQDYYDLLRMMAENRKQTIYLQDYINTECR